MDNWMERTDLLLGSDKIEKLQNARVLIMGLGGVGAYAAELICRAGVGMISVADGDTIHPSNRNRQLLALKSTENINKAILMAQRLNDINPSVTIDICDGFVDEHGMASLLEKDEYDYVVDAIDTLTPKVHLLYHCARLNIPVVSSMGSGGKMDPALIRIADLSESYNCRLAYYLRKKLRKMGVESGIKVVFSPEDVSKSTKKLINEIYKRSVIGTISYMPAFFGCYCASVVIREILET